MIKPAKLLAETQQVLDQLAACFWRAAVAEVERELEDNKRPIERVQLIRRVTPLQQNDNPSSTEMTRG